MHVRLGPLANGQKNEEEGGRVGPTLVLAAFSSPSLY